jgi:CheY-like chemotaxis protein
MTLALGTGLLRSLKAFDNELTRYFEVAAKYRAAARKGVIVLVDKDEELFRLFKFLAERAELGVRVVLVGSPHEAKKLIIRDGTAGIKAVVIDADLAAMSNGELRKWIQSSGADVPVFVKGARDEVSRERVHGERFGALVKEELTPMGYVEALGLPPACCPYVAEFEREMAAAAK